MSEPHQPRTVDPGVLHDPVTQAIAACVATGCIAAMRGLPDDAAPDGEPWKSLHAIGREAVRRHAVPPGGTGEHGPAGE